MQWSIADTVCLRLLTGQCLAKALLQSLYLYYSVHKKVLLVPRMLAMGTYASPRWDNSAGQADVMQSGDSYE